MNVVSCALAAGALCLSAQRNTKTAIAERSTTIAIYHCSIKLISRGKGKSAVAAPAYRAGTKITNEYDGIEHDYTRKGGVVHTEILLPDHVPTQYSNRAFLWNAVEKIEKAKNAQLAREIELALPVELTREQNTSLIREYVNRHFVAAGMCADVCIHDKCDGNPHAHIMLTMRPFEQSGEWGAKQQKEYILDKQGNKIYDPKKRQYKCKSIPTTDWNEQTKAEEWRAAWAESVNAALERGNHAERVDHRSYERQGIDQIPTVHLGVAAAAMEKRGIRTERGDLNREIEITNQRLRQLKARISKLQDWLKEEAGNTQPPTLAEVIQGILTRREQTGRNGNYERVGNLKAASKMLNFLTENNIMDMAGLEEKVNAMYDRQADIRDKLKPIERRQKVLDEHIKQADIYMEFKPLNQNRREMKPKQQEKYIEAHRQQFALFESAERYLNDVMNGKTSLPIKAWKDERGKLTAEHKQLNGAYVSLKDEVKEVEQIKKSVYDIMRADMREQLLRKAQETER